MLLFDDSLNLFLLLNKELFARLKSPTTFKAWRLQGI
jgi:hypothetical protein